jgi:hypothetical protein
MIEKEIAKKAIYLLLSKGFHDPVAGDMIALEQLQKSLYEKYRDDINEELFYQLADELVESGDFYWNDNGKLALSESGQVKLGKVRRP